MLNKVQFIGRLGFDPELKEVGQDSKVCNCRLATNEYYYDDQKHKVEKTQWHNISFWNNSAVNVAKYAKKGDMIYVEGRLTHRSYTDKDGLEKYISDVEVYNFVFLNNQNKQNGDKKNDTNKAKSKTVTTAK